MDGMNGFIGQTERRRRYKELKIMEESQRITEHLDEACVRQLTTDSTDNIRCISCVAICIIRQIDFT